MKTGKYIRREDVDALNEMLEHHRIEKARAKAGMPFIVAFYIALGFGFRWLLGDIFFDGWYWVIGGFAIGLLNILAVGIDFGHRID